MSFSSYATGSPRRRVGAVLVLLGLMGVAIAVTAVLTALPQPAAGGTCGPSSGSSETPLVAFFDPVTIGAGPKPPTSNTTSYLDWLAFVGECQSATDGRILEALAILILSIGVGGGGLLVSRHSLTSIRAALASSGAGTEGTDVGTDVGTGASVLPSGLPAGWQRGPAPSNQYPPYPPSPYTPAGQYAPPYPPSGQYAPPYPPSGQYAPPYPPYPPYPPSGQYATHTPSGAGTPTPYAPPPQPAPTAPYPPTGSAEPAPHAPTPANPAAGRDEPTRTAEPPGPVPPSSAAGDPPAASGDPGGGAG